MSKKMTKREMFEQIKGKLTDENEIAFIDHELELLAKKNATERKPTAKQTANETLKTAILNAMEDNVLYTVSELWKAVPELANDDTMSGQRVSALVKQLKDGGQVRRIEDKRKAYFQKVN
jgi:hypothetical protein